jgi:hypothetical protein
MYATGSPSSLVDLLKDLATFAATAGWTVDQSAAAGVGGVDWILQMHNSVGSYIQLYANMAAGASQYKIDCCGGTAVASSTTLTNQSPNCQMAVLTAGPYSDYHFFAKTTSSPYLHIMLEIQTNLFADLFVGTLNAVGGASPATYVAVSLWPYGGANQSFWDSGVSAGAQLPFHNDANMTRIGVTVDGTLQWFGSIDGETTPRRANLALGSNFGSQYDSILRSPNTFNALAPFFTCPIWVERAVGNIYSYVGDIPDFRFCNITNITPKDEQTIGGDTWKIFPMIQKSNPVNTGGAPASSGPYAVAFLKSA